MRETEVLEEMKEVKHYICETCGTEYGDKRTCEMCEKGHHKEWEFWMYKCCTDPETGEKYGWGRVLNYIGVGWEDMPEVQMSIADYPEVMP